MVSGVGHWAEQDKGPTRNSLFSKFSLNWTEKLKLINKTEKPTTIPKFHKIQSSKIYIIKLNSNRVFERKYGPVQKIQNELGLSDIYFY